MARAMPAMPQWKTKTKTVFNVKLTRVEMIPAHIVERVSLWALTRESGSTDQKAVKLEPARSSGP